MENFFVVFLFAKVLISRLFVIVLGVFAVWDCWLLWIVCGKLVDKYLVDVVL